MKPYETMVVVDVLIESVEQMQVMLMQKNLMVKIASPTRRAKV